MDAMKQKIIVLAIQFAIWILEKAIERVSAHKDGGDSSSIQEDVRINPETAKLFSRFIKKHTVKGENENS